MNQIAVAVILARQCRVIRPTTSLRLILQRAQRLASKTSKVVAAIPIRNVELIAPL